MRKLKVRRHSAVSHALTLAHLTPGVALARLTQLSVADPAQMFAMLAHIISEKVFAFGQAYTSSLMAIGLAQVSLLRLATTSAMRNDVLRSSAAMYSFLFSSGMKSRESH